VRNLRGYVDRAIREIVRRIIPKCHVRHGMSQAHELCAAWNQRECVREIVGVDSAIMS
jgi:hypothetical protein